jgi:hypothetical protein
MNNKDTITVTCNVKGEVVEVEAQTTLTEVKAKDPKRCRVVKGNALPQALRDAPNVVGKLTAAQVEAIKKAQAKKAQRRKRK